ncbi:hypothetical protein AAEH94_22410, partial [Shewanella algae]
RKVAETIRLSRRTHALLWQNIVLALGIKAVFFVLAVFGNATMWNTAIGWRMTNPALPKHWTISNGESAEKIAREWGITREAQDAFAVRSHQRAA